jgi:hypothetical protein
MSRGSTLAVKSLGMGREERKLLLADGIVDWAENMRLYVEMLEFVCKGDACGELYRAMINNPIENMSAPTFKFESNTKSGEQ